MISSANKKEAGPAGSKIRVMVVDDSIVIRGLISRWLSALPDIEVVARIHAFKLSQMALILASAEQIT